MLYTFHKWGQNTLQSVQSSALQSLQSMEENEQFDFHVFFFVLIEKNGPMTKKPYKCLTYVIVPFWICHICKCNLFLCLSYSHSVSHSFHLPK